MVFDQVALIAAAALADHGDGAAAALDEGCRGHHHAVVTAGTRHRRRGADAGGVTGDGDGAGGGGEGDAGAAVLADHHTVLLAGRGAARHRTGNAQIAGAGAHIGQRPLDAHTGSGHGSSGCAAVQGDVRAGLARVAGNARIEHGVVEVDAVLDAGDVGTEAGRRGAGGADGDGAAIAADGRRHRIAALQDGRPAGIARGRGAEGIEGDIELAGRGGAVDAALGQLDRAVGVDGQGLVAGSLDDVEGALQVIAEAGIAAVGAATDIDGRVGGVQGDRRRAEQRGRGDHVTGSRKDVDRAGVELGGHRADQAQALQAGGAIAADGVGGGRTERDGARTGRRRGIGTGGVEGQGLRVLLQVGAGDDIAAYVDVAATPREAGTALRPLGIDRHRVAGRGKGQITVESDITRLGAAGFGDLGGDRRGVGEGRRLVEIDVAAVGGEGIVEGHGAAALAGVGTHVDVERPGDRRDLVVDDNAARRAERQRRGGACGFGDVGIDGDERVGLQGYRGAAGVQGRLHRGVGNRVVRAVDVGGGGHGEGRRVEQPVAALPAWRRQIDLAGEAKAALRRGFHLTTGAAASTPRADGAVHAGGLARP